MVLLTVGILVNVFFHGIMAYHLIVNHHQRTKGFKKKNLLG